MVSRLKSSDINEFRLTLSSVYITGIGAVSYTHLDVYKRQVKCRNSGVPVKEWCRKQGISYSTYYRHERALLKCAQDPSDIPILEQAPQTLPVPFVEVTKMCQATSKTHTDSIVTVSYTHLKAGRGI